jgi:dTDP-4-amino-4,6-dideoxygalactose transaminase
MISCSLSPNTEADDVWLALRILFSPRIWKRGRAVHKVEKRFGGVSFNSGRSALLAILKAFDIGKGDEVIIQAFTCVAVPNSVRWAGAIPVYADIDETYNIDPKDFEKKITKKIKAVIVQHTFGIPAKIEEIIAIAKKYDILVIEDFAHTMSLPMKGDAAFFSFGRDKVISSVFGGLAIINDKCPMPNAKLKLKNYHKKLNTPSLGWIFQQLFHPIAFSIILPLYRIGIGKVILVLLQRLRLLGFPVYKEEKLGRQPDDFPAKYPNALAMLLLNQLKKLDRFTTQRREISRMYGVDKPYLRFPKIVDDPEKIIAHAKKQGILLGNWYHHVVDPVAVGYKTGSCPNAEEAAKHIINLPTRISPKDANRVLEAL